MNRIKGLYQRKNGRFYYDITINGKRKEGSLFTTDFAEAAYKLGEIRKQATQTNPEESIFGAFEDPFADEPMTIKEAFDRAIEERFKLYSNSGTPRCHLKTFTDILGKDMLLQDISAKHVSLLRTRLKKTKSGTSVNRYMTTLSVVLHMARDEWEEITEIPRIPRYKEKGERWYILTQEDEKTALRMAIQAEKQASEEVR